MAISRSLRKGLVTSLGLAILWGTPAAAAVRTCESRAEQRAELFARQADRGVRFCLRRAARHGGTCPDARLTARLARLQESARRALARRCPSTRVEARLDALLDRVFCHRLERCSSRFGSMRLGVVAASHGGGQAPGVTSRRLAVDSGWTGIAHGIQILEGAGFVSELSSCGAAGDARCELFGRTAGKPFGAPSPISAGGVPVCVTVGFATDVVGHVDLERGDVTQSAKVAIGVHVNGLPEAPCPYCVSDDGPPALGAAGRCRGGANDGGACLVTGLAGSEYGAARGTSNDCPPAGLPMATFESAATATTGRIERVAGLPCSDPTTGSCWCAGQYRANGCVDGVCTATGDGGLCASGPFERRCSLATYAHCHDDGDCPAGERCGDPTPRSCFPDPIRLAGTPAPPADGVAHPTLVGLFCMASARVAAVDSAAGYPGPTAFVWPAELVFDR